MLFFCHSVGISFCQFFYKRKAILTLNISNKARFPQEILNTARPWNIRQMSSLFTNLTNPEGKG